MKKIHICLLLLLGVIAIVLLGIMIGTVAIHPGTTICIWINKLSFGYLFKDVGTDIERTIVVDVRTPRVILSLLVGMGLGIAGACMQGIFRNPMAEPYILGISSGAGFGAALAMVLGIGNVFGGLSIPTMAFIGACGAIFIVYNIARIEGRIPTETLLLAGIAIGFLLQAGTSFLKFIAEEYVLRSVVLWLMGSCSMALWKDIRIIILPIILGIILICLLSKELDIFQLGEETASHLGVEVERTKNLLLLACCLITSFSVAFTGIIGFVGLIIPHIVRLIIGPKHSILLPCSALAGGIFLVFCDILARCIKPPIEIPIGIITAIIGGPYFIYLLRRRKRAISWW
jgi:iron complex transport system permease protein